VKIAPADLDSQFDRISSGYPIVRLTEIRFGLPTYCLFAVGSRETNFDPVYLTEPGDGGHGWGWWQLDNRSHTIPPGFPSDVALQASTAAGMLAPDIAKYGEVGAYDVYNSGSPLASHTTGGDYGPDVVERRLYLVGRFPQTGDEEMYWGKDGASLADQIRDARTAKCREWWLAYHGQREPNVAQLQAAVSYWAGNGGDLTQAGIKDGRFGT
jgi:hypothetical protein